MENEIKPYSTVLVLNSSYEPINVTNWKRAIVLLLKEKAQILSRTVIRLLNYVKIPFSKMKSSKPSRAMIYKRDKNTCQYCGATTKLTIDHVIPKSKGGDDSWENLVVACSTCNTKKGNTLLEQTGMKLTKKPKAPNTSVQLSLNSGIMSEWEQHALWFG